MHAPLNPSTLHPSHIAMALLMYKSTLQLMSDQELIPPSTHKIEMSNDLRLIRLLGWIGLDWMHLFQDKGTDSSTAQSNV